MTVSISKTWRWLGYQGRRDRGRIKAWVERGRGEDTGRWMLTRGLWGTRRAGRGGWPVLGGGGEIGGCRGCGVRVGCGRGGDRQRDGRVVRGHRTNSGKSSRLVVRRGPVTGVRGGRSHLGTRRRALAARHSRSPHPDAVMVSRGWCEF